MKYKKCSRLSCLYHAPEQDIMGCDYCYLTGQPRGCRTGSECTKYTRVSYKTKTEYRSKQIRIQEKTN